MKITKLLIWSLPELLQNGKMPCYTREPKRNNHYHPPRKYKTNHEPRVDQHPNFGDDHKLTFIHSFIRSFISIPFGKKSRLDFFTALLERFQGDFDNYNQVLEDRKEGMLPREGGGHEQIHCLLLPVFVASSLMTPSPNDVIGNRKAARLAAFYFDGIPQRIFRFRYYALSETKAGADMKLYCLSPTLEGQLRAMDDPMDWIAAFENYASKHGDENEPAVTLLEKCDVRWSSELDPIQHEYALKRNREIEQNEKHNDLADLGIHAVMTYGEATVDSTMMPGQKIRIMDQLSLWEDQFWIHDRGFDPETGAFIYGNQRGIPYRLERVANILQNKSGDINSTKRQVVNEPLQWTLGPTWRTEEEYEAKLDALGGGVSSQLNMKEE